MPGQVNPGGQTSNSTPLSNAAGNTYAGYEGNVNMMPKGQESLIAPPTLNASSGGGSGGGTSGSGNAAAGPTFTGGPVQTETLKNGTNVGLTRVNPLYGKNYQVP